MSDKKTDNKKRVTENSPKIEEDIAIAERGTGKKKIPGHIIINKNADRKANWFVVHTTSGHEVRVSETLRQRVETMGFENITNDQIQMVMIGLVLLLLGLSFNEPCVFGHSAFPRTISLLQHHKTI